MTKKQKLLIIVSAAVLVVLVAGALLLWKGFSAKPEGGTKNITFQIKYKNGLMDYAIETDEEYLANALVDAELIEYDEEGLYTTINGFTADYEKDKAYWWLTCNGEDMMVGMNDQPIKDGDAYVATYTVSE